MSKKPPTNEDLDAMFAGIDDAQPSAPGTTSTTTSSGTSTKKPTPTSTEASVDDDDPLAELANLAAAPRVSASISRPQTPRTSTGPSSTRSKAEVTYTPTSTTASGRTSEEKPASVEQRVSQEAPREVPATAPVAEQSPASGGGGGWGGWGGWATNLASAAVKQAQGAVKEIQKSEEAQKWAEQVKGYGGGLQGLQGLRGLNIGMCRIGLDVSGFYIMTSCQATSRTSAIKLSLHSRISCILWHHRYPSTKDYKSTSPTTFPAIRHSIRSSTKPSRASCPKLRAVIY